MGLETMLYKSAKWKFNIKHLQIFFPKAFLVHCMCTKFYQATSTPPYVFNAIANAITVLHLARLVVCGNG